jgi:hypothetical protein
MLRKTLLIVLAVLVSFALTGIAGYLIYANSASRSEANLSLVACFAINPIIAILIGVLVGFLSKDHAVLTAVLGLLPWTVLLLGTAHQPTSLAAWAGWLAPMVICLPLAAAAASVAWRYRCRVSSQSSRLA